MLWVLVPHLAHTPHCLLQAVKLNKTQMAMLLSEEGQTAAWFAKQLVTINTTLKAPPLQ